MGVKTQNAKVLKSGIGVGEMLASFKKTEHCNGIKKGARVVLRITIANAGGTFPPNILANAGLETAVGTSANKNMLAA